MAALPEVNPKPESTDDEKSYETRGALGRVFQKDISREVLRQSIRDGQLDLKVVLQDMAKSLRTMVKLDTEALKRMREQAGFQLESKREGGRGEGDDESETMLVPGMEKKKKGFLGKLLGLFGGILSGIGLIFKGLLGGLGFLGKGLLKSLGLKSLLGMGLRPLLKGIFSKGFFLKMVGLFAIPALLVAFAEDIAQWLKDSVPHADKISSFFDPSKLGSSSIASWAIKGGAGGYVAMRLFGFNPWAIVIGAVAGIALSAAIHVNDWLKARANKNMAKMDKELEDAYKNKEYIAATARVSAAKEAGQKADPKDLALIKKHDEETKKKIVTSYSVTDYHSGQGAYTNEGRALQTAFYMDPKKPDSSSLDKAKYQDAVRLMDQIRKPKYFQAEDKDSIYRDAERLKFLIQSVDQGWAHRYFGGDHGKAVGLWSKMMDTMDYMHKSVGDTIKISHHHDQDMMKHLNYLRNFSLGKDDFQNPFMVQLAQTAITEKIADKQLNRDRLEAEAGLRKALAPPAIRKNQFEFNKEGAKPIKPVNPNVPKDPNQVKDTKELFWNPEATSDMTTDDDEWFDSRGRELQLWNVNRNASALRYKKRNARIKAEREKKAAEQQRLIDEAAFATLMRDYGDSDGDDTGGSNKMLQFWRGAHRVLKPLQPKVVERGSEANQSLVDHEQKKLVNLQKQVGANIKTKTGHLKLRPMHLYDIAGNPNTTIINKQGDTNTSVVNNQKTLTNLRSKNTDLHPDLNRNIFWTWF